MGTPRSSGCQQQGPAIGPLRTAPPSATGEDSANHRRDTVSPTVRLLLSQGNTDTTKGHTAPGKCHSKKHLPGPYPQCRAGVHRSELQRVRGGGLRSQVLTAAAPNPPAGAGTAPAASPSSGSSQSRQQGTGHPGLPLQLAERSGMSLAPSPNLPPSLPLRFPTDPTSRPSPTRAVLLVNSTRDGRRVRQREQGRGWNNGCDTQE